MRPTESPRSDVVDLHVTARGVIAAERRTAVDARTGERIDRSALPDEVVAALDAAVRLAQQVLDGDNAVLVQGGLVTNSPALPVVNLEFLEDDDVCIEEAAQALDRAEALGWSSVAEEVRAYLERHARLDPETGQWLRREVGFYERESFKQAVQRHFQYPPSTWRVRKRGTRSWGIVIGGPDGEGTADTFTTKRDATAALDTGRHPYRRIWEDSDAWYRGDLSDPRNRPLKPWEREVVAQVQRELEEASAATSGAVGEQR